MIREGVQRVDSAGRCNGNFLIRDSDSRVTSLESRFSFCGSVGS